MANMNRNPGGLLSLCFGSLLAATVPALADTGHNHHEHEGTAPAQKPWGLPADAGMATRTIDVAMGDDMRFAPDRVQIGQGEVVKFVLHNGGRLPHEMVIGTGRELKEHALAMATMP